jgi:hypothetical protein
VNRSAASLPDVRARRLRAPLLLALWLLLAFEALAARVIFCARLILGAHPARRLHVIAASR